MLRPYLLAAGVALSCALLSPVAADARQSAHINARFDPERLGAATALSFAFTIAPAGAVPAPLTAMSIAYPKNLGFATSGLGVAACSPQTLQTLGSEACPPDSKMGSGSAIVEIPIGPNLIAEHVALDVFAGPSPDGYLHVLVGALGKLPVEAAVVLSGVLLPGELQIVVPPIPSLPEAPYVAVAQMQLTLGGHLTYYERVRGRMIAYHPTGVGLPSSCPHSGFGFAASFAFEDGSVSHAQTAVPCPHPGTVSHSPHRGVKT